MSIIINTNEAPWNITGSAQRILIEKVQKDVQQVLH